VGEVERPAINRDEGSTLAFSKAQARKVLDAPAEDTIVSLRDRAILSLGLQVGLRAILARKFARIPCYLNRPLSSFLRQSWPSLRRSK
jgi:hypothetical protein